MEYIYRSWDLFEGPGIYLEKQKNLFEGPQFIFKGLKIYLKFLGSFCRSCYLFEGHVIYLKVLGSI